MNEELKGLMGEVSALEERFLESGEHEDEIEGTDSQIGEERGEARIFAEMLRNSVHTAQEVLGLMLNPEHESFIKTMFGDSGLEKLKAYQQSVSEMHSAIHEALGGDEDEEEEEEKEPDEEDGKEGEGEEEEQDKEEELKNKEEARLDAASEANEESEEEQEEEEGE